MLQEITDGCIRATSALDQNGVSAVMHAETALKLRPVGLNLPLAHARSHANQIGCSYGAPKLFRQLNNLF